MQTEDKGMDTDSSKVQVNEPSLSNKEHNSGREMSGNSHEFHDENKK